MNLTTTTRIENEETSDAVEISDGEIWLLLDGQPKVQLGYIEKCCYYNLRDIASLINSAADKLEAEA